MKFRYLFILMVFCFNTTWADFSHTGASIHPLYLEANEPFIIDIQGEWPTDCHPGEQQPVISEYTGDTALIEFETIVEHVTCNDVATPYRVLIDMSDVVGSLEGEFKFVDVTVRYDGAELEVKVPDTCIYLCSPVPLPRDIKPEAGLYHGDGLEKQGLLLARQDQRMATYALIYDESGSSEWVFGGGGIVEDAYFVDLYELTGGQCLGCPVPDEPPQMDVVGKLSMLMDSEGVVQVKVNDGLFETYQPSEFGYGHFRIMHADTGTPVNVPALSGRWAFSGKNKDLRGDTTTPPTSVLPLVFDVALRSTVNPPGPVTTPPPSASVFYAIQSIEGDMVAEMACASSGEMFCELRVPEFENFDESYKIRMLSVKRMIMQNMAPRDPADGVIMGISTAVRID